MERYAILWRKSNLDPWQYWYDALRTNCIQTFGHPEDASNAWLILSDGDSQYVVVKLVPQLVDQ